MSTQGPLILSAAFATGAEVGRTALLKVRAVDPSRPVSGLEVHFGEPRGRVGRSACSVPSFGPSIAPVTQTVPYAFRRPGPHRITIDVLSGSCAGTPRRASTTIEVDVDPRHSTPPPAAPGRCADRRLEPTTANRPRVAAAVLCLVNVERRRRGRPNLRRSPRLARAAANHSKDMLTRRFHGHAGPGGPSLQARVRRVGYRGTTYGENTAYRDDATAERIVRDWMNSHGHKSNILHARLRFAGVGIVIGIPVTPRLPGSTYTMDFGATIR